MRLLPTGFRGFVLVGLIFGFVPDLGGSEAWAGWRAGIADVEIKPPYQVALGGFGGGARRAPFSEWFKNRDAHLLRPHTGIHDPIRIKAVHLEEGEGEDVRKVLFIGMDVVGITMEMHEAIASRLESLGYRRSELMISGTHTHSGPGALSNNPFWVIMAMDLFHRKFHAWWLEQTVEAVRLAISRLEPVEVFSTRFEASGIQRNRRRSDHVVDRTAHALFARSMDGRWLGGLVNLPVHGVSIGQDCLEMSADTPGAIERHAEKLLVSRTRELGLEADPTVLFVNGAEGDISPEGYGFDGMELMGLKFGEQLGSAWPGLAPLPAGIEAAQYRVELGRPTLAVENCEKNSWLRRLRIGVRSWFPDSAELFKLRLGGEGGVSMFTWPGEATSELGIAVREAAEARGSRDAWILGLTNGHLGYFTSAWDYDLGGYETCVNFYGRDGGEKIREAHLKEIP